MPGKRKMKRHQALSPTHPWPWRAVCEARPTGGDGPDAGGSAFFDRTKNDGMFQKKHPYLSKTAQSPQVVGAAGKTAFSLVLSFGQAKESTDAEQM